MNDDDAAPSLLDVFSPAKARPPAKRAAASAVPATPTLMLLDTYGLVYAAFFAMKDRPLTTSRGGFMWRCR